jgi:predicted DNA-binding transcriptional regulator AlpA
MKNSALESTASVLERTATKSRVTLWRRVRAGTFPAPVDLGGGRIAWVRSEIDAWIETRPRVAWASSKLTAPELAR